MRRVPWLLVAAFLLAGCGAKEPLLGPDPGLPFEYYDYDEYPNDLNHDHADPALHNASFNAKLVGFQPCSPIARAAEAPGGFSDIAFYEKYAYVGHSKGFCVLDLSSPTAPKLVANYDGEGASDMEVSDDGKIVFLPTQRNRLEDLTLTDPNAPGSHLPRGVAVVNVADPAHPTFLSFYPVPTNGVHTITPYKMDGRQIVFIQTYDWLPPADLMPPGLNPPTPQQNSPATQRIEVTELVNVNNVPTLKRLTSWSFERPADDVFVRWFPHDSFAEYHPLLKKHLLYVAYWDAGLVVLDVSDPATPRLLSQTAQKEPSWEIAFHDVKTFPTLIDGRHITVTGPEFASGPKAGHVRMFDTTDPAKPVQMGTWRLPGDPGTSSGFMYSPHVFTLDNGTIYIGYYHGGVWAIDVHNETLLREPKTIGFYFPRGNEETKDWSPSSSTWGAYYRNGYVYATESSSGVHVIDFRLPNEGSREPAAPGT